MIKVGLPRFRGQWGGAGSRALGRGPSAATKALEPWSPEQYAAKRRAGRGPRSLAVQGGGRRRQPEAGQGARDRSGTSLAGWRRPRKCSRPAGQGAGPANGPVPMHLQGRPDHPATPAAVLQPSGPSQDGTGVAGTPVRTVRLLLAVGHGISGTCDMP